MGLLCEMVRSNGADLQCASSFLPPTARHMTGVFQPTLRYAVSGELCIISVLETAAFMSSQNIMNLRVYT